MSKIRNSLGVLVLPIPDEEMTWEQYKAKYGIDLALSLGLFKNEYGHSLLSFPRKFIYLDDPRGALFIAPIYPVPAFGSTSIKNADEEDIGNEYFVPYLSYEHSDFSLMVVGELSIKVYDDPETPNTIFYTEV